MINLNDWRYIRFCPYCKQDKEYLSKRSKNNKYRCPDCLKEYHKQRYGHNRFKCIYCKRVKTDSLDKLLNHFTRCSAVVK